jgi:hypothetical protein
VSAKDETRVTEEDVWREHVEGVNTVAHWIYLFGVLTVSFLLMVGLIALLGGGGA